MRFASQLGFRGLFELLTFCSVDGVCFGTRFSELFELLTSWFVDGVCFVTSLDVSPCLVSSCW